MLNPNKWPKKYQYLVIFIVFIIIFLLGPSKSHAEEPQNHKEHQGKELLKDATKSGLAAVLNFYAATQSVALGSFPAL